MRKRGFNLGYFIAEGFQSIFSHGLMSFAAVCMIVACLIIMGSFSLLAVNADQMLTKEEEKNEFFAYIDENCGDEEAARLAETVKALPNVASVEFTSKEDAHDAWVADHPGGVELPVNVFRDRLAVHVFDLELFTDTVDAVTALPGVADYSAHSELAQGFVLVRHAATILATVLVAILAAVSLFIIANTIRLAAFTRREEIGIMKICGATDSFVRWPFIFEGLILGVFGAAVAFLIQWGIYSLVMNALASSGVLTLFTPVAFSTMWLPVLGMFLLAGVLIGTVGSGFAISRFLKV